tara:strand:- start:352 stop:1818 length:1467 start_codon:yes stop_codon:yes gene_type:complete
MALTQISTAGVKDDAVTSGKIPANAVGSSELADNAVDTAAIADDAVTSAKLASSSVGSDALGSQVVTTANIANSAITSAKLASSSVDSNALGSQVVVAANIADQAVTLAKLPHGTSSNDGKFLRANNGADPSFESVPSPAITSIASASNNRVITSNGGTTVNAEPNLTFDGSILEITSNADGVLNLDTSASNGAFVRFGQGGTFHNMVGCADGLTSGDKEDLGVRAYDNIIFSTGGSTERMRLDSSGRLGIGTGSSITNYDPGARTLILNESGTLAGMTIRSSNQGSIYFADGTSGNESYRGRIEYDHANDRMSMGAGASTSGIHIDSDCIVTKPNHPAFMAKLYTTAQINNGIRNFSNSDGLKVNGNQGHYLTRVDYNRGSHYNSSTTRFTAPIAGIYVFEVVMSSNSQGPASAYWAPEIYINGSRYSGGWQQQESTGYQKVRQSFYFELAANDYVEPGYESQQTVTLGGNNDAYKFYTYFTGYLVA